MSWALGCPRGGRGSTGLVSRDWEQAWADGAEETLGTESRHMATELRERKRLRAELESVMGRRGLRSTSQRRLILDRLFEIGEHFTADDLIADVR